MGVLLAGEANLHAWRDLSSYHPVEVKICIRGWRGEAAEAGPKLVARVASSQRCGQRRLWTRIPATASQHWPPTWCLFWDEALYHLGDKKLLETMETTHKKEHTKSFRNCIFPSQLVQILNYLT